jgi:hypothetical protein
MTLLHLQKENFRVNGFWRSPGGCSRFLRPPSAFQIGCHFVEAKASKRINPEKREKAEIRLL